MVFVFKDLLKPAHRITVIPMENLEIIKSWLDGVDILFSEGIMNLNWVNLLSRIRNDLEDFIENGGWNFLHDDVNIYIKISLRKKKEMRKWSKTLLSLLSL